MTTKYRKKPVVIEAIQWTGRNINELADFLGDCLGPIERRPDYTPKIKGRNDATYFWVSIYPFDWVYKNSDGIFHVSTDKWFQNDYEKVVE
jgi:hypothetical protein